MEKRAAGILLCNLLSGREMPDAKLRALPPADWRSLADWALSLRVGGLLYRETTSRNITPEIMPADARNSLREAYRNLATINTSRFLDAAKAIKRLADHQIPVIALKGLSLAGHIYGDIALRPMHDIDLLVREDDLLQAGHVLLDLGYKQSFPAWEDMVRAFHHLPPFTNSTGAVMELHRNIVTPESPIRVDLDGLWERACLIKIDNVEVRALCPEDTMLHMCIHAIGHLQTGFDLIPLCDIARLMNTTAGRLDWRTIIDRAAQWRGHKCVYLMLLLVRELFGNGPPDQVMSELKPDDYRPEFLDSVLEQMFDGDASRAGQLISVRVGRLAEIRDVRGAKGKVMAFLKRAFPPKERLARIYPVSVSSPRIYLCYLHRLGRLSLYYALVLVRLLRRDQSLIKAIRREGRVSAVSDWLSS